MGDMKEHPLLTRFPDDAKWALFGDSTLHGQCSVRNIPNDEASRSDMIRLLQKYQQKHVTEVRKIPWCRSPEFATGSEKREHLAMYSTYLIVRVKDKSCSDGTVFRKDFSLLDKEGSIYVVAFKEIPTCTCSSQSKNHIPAVTMARPLVTGATTTATIASAPPAPTTNLVHKSIERKDKDDHDMKSSNPSKEKDGRDTQVENNPTLNEGTSQFVQPPATFYSLSSKFPTSSRSALSQQELLPSASPQQLSQASKDGNPQAKDSISIPAVHPQRSMSVPLTSNPSPMQMELKQHKAQERAEKSLRGVSQDFSSALVKSLSSVPSVYHPNSNASAPRAPTPEQAGLTPVLPADGVDAHNSAATTAAVTAQTAPPVSPDDISGDLGCSSPVSNKDADVLKRQAARLVRKCRHLERKSARIEKHLKRGMDKIDREYKLELMMLKEKRKIKYMKIEKKWEHDMKGLKHQREKFEEKLKDLD
ncbi:hypothetical protein NEUTE1DRAFT_99957 [Neurospora tetrasperma FGSC 2508]|uniref:Uncharacterized protein n=1 Tax=Neurospora tetrasperma (strain FGSC 2508 / ATCC MYA-4615 / P0657) TaxID=510951 RepID=F8MIK4_NEUT8|nr:uncharacterized protein NEUTE1DRAFT_99957 [Neurospora tetrasperma FGSC 2508]EGO59805.1 hypothetical protein NEUTE1DRAFT_99957 [Neurospora tetrasperma FGSC 2508]EGZ73953.1 hypothetical protein NEUTE2DRAFT_128298 [Neurospora tetrasperma FGSC 2509]